MTAQSQFVGGVVEVRLLLELSGQTINETSVDRDNAVRRASVVLLVSHFESSLKTLAEEYVDFLNSGQFESRQIPNGIRELHTIPRMQAIVDSKDPVERNVLLKKLPSMSALWNDSAKPSPGTLNAQLVSRQVTNADSKTIDALFDLMGSSLKVCDGDLDVPFGTEGESLPTNIRLSLTDVVKCRNDIAHGDIDRKPTEEDLERYINFLSVLSDRLQKKCDALVALFAP